MSLRPRILPIVIGAACGLLFLKVVGVLVGGEGEISGTAPVFAQQEAKTDEQAAEAPAGEGEGEKQAAADDQDAPKSEGVVYKGGTESEGDAKGQILDRLSERRKELDALEAEILEREGLLSAAEKRVEERIAELRTIEEKINATIKKRDDEEKARFNGLIKMYETMKAKSAARIFDRLDMGILVEVASRMSPERMGAIMAVMSAEAAERLTVAMAIKQTQQMSQPLDPDEGSELPKIIGKPQGS